MPWTYPVDVKDLIAQARRRGKEFLQYLGREDELRDDLELTVIVWGAGTGWFPITEARKWHGAVDIGLPDMEGESYYGAQVLSIGDGEVVFAESGVRSEEGYDYGRVIAQHRAPAGDFYVLYQHLCDVGVSVGDKVKGGQILGTVGWHGDFPHLHFAIASTSRLGGEKDLVPEATADKLPEGEGAWNVLRVSAGKLDAAEWPGLPAGEYFLFNPIELVRFLRGEEYQHEKGRAAPHAVEAAENKEQKVEPGEANTIQIASILQSSPLKPSDVLQKMASDPGSPPLKAGADKEAVKAVQRALKKAGYSMGRFGPDKDGIDGDYGKTTAIIVKEFKAKKLREMTALFELWGRSYEDIKDNGELDWLSLLALDTFVAALETEAPKIEEKEKKKTEEKKKAADEAPPPRPTKTEPPPPQGEWVFDGEKKELSMRFGMRMYKALLGWERNDAKGTGANYSAAFGDFVVFKKEIAEAGIGSAQWPEMGYPGVETKPAKGRPAERVKEVIVHKGIGINWYATGFTNCCNSQLAAVYGALDAKPLRLKKDGVILTFKHDNSDPTPTMKVQGVKGKYSMMKVYESLSVGNDKKGEDGKALTPKNCGGWVGSGQWLGIGEVIVPWTKEGAKGDDYWKNQDLWKKVRMGDPGNYGGHAWLVGDARYIVSFEDGAKYAVDQSSFVDKPEGILVKHNGKSYAYAEPKTDKMRMRPLMTAADCEWIIANEKEFQTRMDTFLAAKELTVDGAKKKVKAIEVGNFQCFSANGNRYVSHGRKYSFKAGVIPEGLKEEEKKKKEREAEKDIANFDLANPETSWWFGITRPWNPLKKSCFFRFYGPA